jgi:hypothetical protein
MDEQAENVEQARNVIRDRVARTGDPFLGAATAEDSDDLW